MLHKSSLQKEAKQKSKKHRGVPSGIDRLTAKGLDKMAKNTGCELHNDCLTCPLPQCQYDVHGPGRNVLRRQEREELIKQKHCSESMEEIADELGVSTQTVRRALAQEASL